MTTPLLSSTWNLELPGSVVQMPHQHAVMASFQAINFLVCDILFTGNTTSKHMSNSEYDSSPSAPCSVLLQTETNIFKTPPNIKNKFLSLSLIPFRGRTRTVALILIPAPRNPPLGNPCQLYFYPWTVKTRMKWPEKWKKCAQTQVLLNKMKSNKKPPTNLLLLWGLRETFLVCSLVSPDILAVIIEAMREFTAVFQLIWRNIWMFIILAYLSYV